MKVVRVAIAVFVIALLAGSVVMAGPFGPRDAKGHAGPGGPKGECMGTPPSRCAQGPKMLDPEQLTMVGATEKQIEALKQFEYEQQLKRIDLRAGVEKAELALNHSMRSNSVDEKALLTAVDTLNQARGELLKLDVTSELQVKNVLGDEVFSKMRERRPLCRGEHRGRERRGRGRRGHERRFRGHDMSQLEEEPDSSEQ